MITTLSQLAAQVESGNNPGALRFEPAFRPSAEAIINCKKANACSNATALVLCAMSFGKYQIMGENLWGLLGYTVDAAHYLNNEDLQDSSYWNFCQRKGIGFSLIEVLHDPAKRLQYARLYNGPGNPVAYGDRMLSEYKASGGVL